MKYKAALFLINNMHWHSVAGYVEKYDSKVSTFINKADSIYYTLFKGNTIATLNSRVFLDTLKNYDTPFREQVQKSQFSDPEVFAYAVSDVEAVNAKFLIDHIDNAFVQRKNNPITAKLSFQDFLEFVLPYRVIPDYIFVQNGKDLSRYFHKYVNSSIGKSIEDKIFCYNTTVSRLRWFQGKYPFATNIGLGELFFRGVHDCVDIANYGALALRACGIPIAVEFNIAYKMYEGRHYHCAVPVGNNKWATFSPESELPKLDDAGFEKNGAMNIYRFYFSARKNTPYFLKNEQEYVPELLSNPCIEDVTDNVIKTTSLTLPFLAPTNNNLAYLATFHRSDPLGYVPVTWGIIDKNKRNVHFTHVIPNRFYIPIYYTEKHTEVFGSPFFLKKDEHNNIKIVYLESNDRDSIEGSIILTRKFPRKQSMIDIAKELIGSVVLASNHQNFKDADTLFVIDSLPKPQFQDMGFQNEKAYQYYRIKTPESFKHAHFAELEFLTHRKYGYSNIMEATPLPILSPKSNLYKEESLVRLMDEPLEKIKWKAEYDGNVQTAPSKWPTVSFFLKKPQVVTTIHYVPKHEDNGINPTNEYELSYWDKGRWNKLPLKRAQYHYLKYENVPLGKVYWLKNITTGKEEMPFVLDEKGNQHFIYE